MPTYATGPGSGTREWIKNVADLVRLRAGSGLPFGIVIEIELIARLRS
jgi:hypothetical protein